MIVFVLHDLTRRFARPGRGGQEPRAGSISLWRVAARLAYLAVIALATLSNLDIAAAGAEEMRSRLSEALAPDVAPRDVVDGLRNLLLFAGWGLVWCMTAPDGRLRRGIVAATVTGVLISGGVEAAQLFSSRRQPSVLDLLTNTGGALLGGVGAVVLLHIVRSLRRARSFVGMPMLVFAASYGAAAMLEILLPGLRQELLAGASGGAAARFRLASGQIGWGGDSPGESLLQILLMVPAGAFAVAALVELGRSYTRALAYTALGGVLLPLILELGRGTTGQPIEIGRLVAHAVGLVGGAWLAARYLPALTRRYRGSARPLLLLAFHVGVLLLWGWRPFALHFSLAELQTSFSAGHLMPLTALAMKVDLFSASDVAVSFLLPLPIGALLAVWPLRRTGWLGYMYPGIWAVTAIETGQLLIADRFFDTTDLIIGVSGVLAGWWIMRRAGFRPYGELLHPAAERSGAGAGRRGASRSRPGPTPR